ncbi:MAG: hypothetical protein F6K04_01445 [Leptolyngbya sp. SIO4C5]|nr:hypothetical protein [Leptolyngbya sp. SIO4C5]
MTDQQPTEKQQQLEAIAAEILRSPLNSLIQLSRLKGAGHSLSPEDYQAIGEIINRKLNGNTHE